MIEHLTIGSGAYFYLLKQPLSRTAIDDLFRTMRSHVQKPAQNLFRVVRAAHQGSLYSTICFSFERNPSFLEPSADAVERVFGYFLLIERDGYLAISKSGLEIPASFKSRFLDKIGSDSIERAIAREHGVFELLRLRNLSASRYSLRNKTFEALDLENAVPTTSANRFATLGYRVRYEEQSYSATPSTGRITMRADRQDWREAVSWANAIIDLIRADDGIVANFIRNFARPLSISSIPEGVIPTYLAIDVPSLTERLFESDASIRVVRHDDGRWVDLKKAEIDPLLNQLDCTFTVKIEADALVLRNPIGAGSAGTIKLHKNRIAMNLVVPSIADLMVEDRGHPLGCDPERRPLAQYLDREDLCTVLFSDLALAYVGGVLFRDDALLGGGTEFMRHLMVEPALALATSEKGAFAPGQKQFSKNSIFRIVVDNVSRDADTLVCDDLGDEWADFIGISSAKRPALITFYHAKHGHRSLSASSFHDAVGQANKNLARLTLPAGAMAAKYRGWDSRYRNNGITTSIPRLMRGGPLDVLAEEINIARSAPDLNRRVLIVTSSLSFADVETAFSSAKDGRPPSPHFVQLYWLLSTYFASCVEFGAVGYVVCQP